MQTSPPPRARLPEASRNRPCPVCGATRWCLVAHDGSRIGCHKISHHSTYGVGRTRPNRNGEPIHWYNPVERATSPIQIYSKPAEQRPDVSPLGRKFADAITADLLAELAVELGLPARAVEEFPGIGYKAARKMWTFPEYDHSSRNVGFSLRGRGGKKGFELGTSRGLTLSPGWATPNLPLLIVEGASDVIALAAAGLPSLGRPSNLGGVNDLAELLRCVPAARKIIVVGESDWNRGVIDRRWPGRIGAYRTATHLAAQLDRQVGWSMVPDCRGKDVRDWLVENAKGSGDRRRWESIGVKLLEAIQAEAVTAQPGWAEMPGAEPIHRCEQAFRSRMKGKVGGKREGLRSFWEFRCDRWICRQCRPAKLNEWMTWLYACVISHGDHERSNDLFSGPDTPGDNAKSGPWDLFVAFVTQSEARSITKHLNEENAENLRQIEYVAIKTTSPPSIWGQLIYSGKCPKKTKCPQNKGGSPDTFLVVAASPFISSIPKKLVRVSSDEAIAGIGEAIKAVATHADGKRLRPVNTSEGWRRVEEQYERMWLAEGTSGLEIADVEASLAAAGVRPLPGPKVGKTIQGGTLYANHGVGGDLASWHLSALCDPRRVGRQLDADEIANLHSLWRPHLEGCLEGENAYEFLLKRLGNPPCDIARLAQALDLDREMFHDPAEQRRIRALIDTEGHPFNPPAIAGPSSRRKHSRNYRATQANAAMLATQGD